ncbi:calcium-binding protein [uncultured Tateyamaria sp.]|uniref:calcium-binding protein n=1 Tax=uncultured Tateyamaria sp. TaxID=455651 RepID=UPI00260D008D|nr:calcium-binding protein [uncultured Tateyamaria sp.]
MTQVAFNHVATVPDGNNMFLTGVTDMIVAETSQGPVLYTVARFGGGDLVAYRINANGSLTQIDTQTLPGGAQAGAINSLALVDDGAGGQDLLVTGVNNTGLYRVELSAAGGMSAPAPITGAAMPATLLDSTAVVVNGTTYIYSIDRGSDEIGIWSVNGNGSVSMVRDGGNGNAGAVGLTSLEQAAVGNTTYLVAASGVDNALIIYRLNNAGVAIEVDRISNEDEVGIGGASVVETVTVAGQVYAILGAAGSGTLSVAAIADNGTLTLTDHVMDTLHTRFAGVHDIATVTHGGRAYVAAAGSDDGITLYEMMPDGRLRHMGTVEDAVNTTLDAVSALSLTVVNGALHVAVSSASEAGLTVFSVDIGAMASPITGGANAQTLTGGAGDDLIDGGAGNDLLRGEGGDDVLIDGAGSDTLWGGAGADVFVLSGDGARDVINDFDITRDTLDLSDWPLLRYASQLTFSTRSDGITIRFGDEELVIRTANGQPLSAQDILALDLIGQSRFLPDWQLPYDDTPDPDPDPTPDPDPDPTPDPDPDPVPDPDPDPTPDPDPDPTPDPDPDPDPTPDPDPDPGSAPSQNLMGTNAADTLVGDTGNDTLTGLNQNDELSGMGGDDTLDGGAGDDVLRGNAGGDLITGGDGDDSIWGGTGFDTINGLAGDDSIWGGDGFDVAGGGDGNDLLVGNNGADLLYGDNGNDTLNGGLNADTLAGGNGNDVLSGSAGSDDLRGNAGNDQLDGNAGADILNGGHNNDTLNGGINHDTLIGGSGNDRLNGNNGADSLMGDGGNDTLAGNAGHDTLDGGGADDYLFGGIGADTFIFNSGDDEIADFQNNIDTLVLDRALWGGGGMSVNALSQFAEVVNGDLVLDFGGGNSLTLNGITSLNVLNGDLDFI